MGNPLVAESEGPSPVAGISLSDDVYHACEDVFTESNGLNALFDLGAAAVDGWMLVEDPFGSLIAYGVGWLMEHIPGLSDWWNKLSGDPEEIGAVATTWQNIGNAMSQTGQQLAGIDTEVENWQGRAKDSFAKVALAFETSISSTAQGCAGLGLVTNLVGGIVTALREIVYTIIKDFIEFTVIPAVLSALATSWCTFGGSLAAATVYIEIQADFAAEQITWKVTETTEKIYTVSERSAKVIESLLKASEKIKGLEHGLEEFGKEAAKLAAKDIGTKSLRTPISPVPTDGKDGEE
jgi:hypothetical protein